MSVALSVTHVGKSGLRLQVKCESGSTEFGLGADNKAGDSNIKDDSSFQDNDRLRYNYVLTACSDLTINR
jgi:hypothetical protein